MSYLRSGIFLAPFHNLTENPTLAIERDMELLQHIDQLNYHEAWIGEHHSGGFEIIGVAGNVHRRSRGTHATYPLGDRRGVPAVPQSVHPRRPHGAA